jgi:hypothetical protein
MKKTELKKLIQEVYEEIKREAVEIDADEQEEMTRYQLIALHEKTKKMLEIMDDETILLEPWMIDKISQSFHNITTVANVMMFDENTEEGPE